MLAPFNFVPRVRLLICRLSVVSIILHRSLAICSLEQWEIHKLDPAYECAIGMLPTIDIRYNCGTEQGTSPDPVLQQMLKASPETDDISQTMDIDEELELNESQPHSKHHSDKPTTSSKERRRTSHPFPREFGWSGFSTRRPIMSRVRDRLYKRTRARRAKEEAEVLETLFEKQGEYHNVLVRSANAHIWYRKF